MGTAPHDPLCILVTGAGAPGIRGTLFALRNNSDGRPVRIVGVDANPDVVGRFLVDKFYRLPFPENSEYLEVLIEICQRESINLVIPQTTREVEVLSRNRDKLIGLGIPTMVSGWPAIEVANNKWRLIKRFGALGFPAPRSELAASEDELREHVSSFGYPDKPVAVKPPFSNGMRGVRVLKENAWDVRRFLTEKPGGLEISCDDLVKVLRQGPGWPELLVMEYLPGPEYSVDVFMGAELQLAIPRLRKSIRSGITFEAVLDFRDDLCGCSVAVAADLGLQYAVGFQFKLDEHSVPKLLECNPRVQGTMVASVFGGANVIWLSVKELIGERPDSLPVLQNAVFYRFWGGVGVANNNVFEI